MRSVTLIGESDLMSFFEVENLLGKGIEEAVQRM